jgi:hypothetical protein
MWIVARVCPPQFLQDRSQVRQLYDMAGNSRWWWRRFVADFGGAGADPFIWDWAM